MARTLLSTLIVVAATSLLASGCGGDSKAEAPPAAASGGSADAVTIDDFKFSPATLTVPAGTRVTVTNDDSTAHTATADDGSSFDTGTIAPGKPATIAVPKPGRYGYHCDIHPFMKATIVAR